VTKSRSAGIHNKFCCDILYFSDLEARMTGTIGSMHLALFGMRLLEVLFFTGLIGSAVVVLISFIEDARELFGEE